MKTRIGKMVLLPVLLITGLAYASIKGINIDVNTNSNQHINGVSSVIPATQTPEVKFKDENGKTVSLNSLKGKVVFINFWATWCPPCIAEMPSINKLYSEFRDNDKVMFLMVDVDNNRAKSEKFMKKRKFNLPVYTPAGPVPPSYLGGSIPTTLVLNKDGKVVFKHEGMSDFSNGEFKSFLTKLTAE
ncbi:MAG: TlpA disulfide reductase family protein [Anditalea sp.]